MHACLSEWRYSMIIVVALHGEVVNNSVTLDVGGGRAILHDDWRPVQVDAVVDNEEGIVVVDDIIVHADTIQVLLQQVLEEQVLLLKSSLLLLDGQLVQVHLVVALVEVVKLLELIVGVWIYTNYLLDSLLRILLSVRVRLVEGKHLFFLSFQFTAKLSCLEDTLTETLVALQCLHAFQTIGYEGAQVLLLGIPQLRHFLLQLMVVSDDGVSLAPQCIVTIVIFPLELLGLEGEPLRLLLHTIDVLLQALDLLRRLVVAGEKLRVKLGLGLCLVHVLLEINLELVVMIVDLLDQFHLHRLLLLDILVPDLLLLGQECLVHGLELGLLLLVDSLDHLPELLRLGVVAPGDVRLLPIVFILEDANIALKFLVQATHSAFLQSDQVIDVNQVVPQGHLVLFFGLVEVTIKHLQDGILGIDLSIVVLLVNLYLLL